MSQKSMFFSKLSDSAFKLVPISSDCPYLECRYDQESGLNLTMKETIEVFRMLNQLDAKGQAKTAGTGKKQEPMLERVFINAPYDHYVTPHSEVIELVNLLCVNPPDGAEIAKYFEQREAAPHPVLSVIKDKDAEKAD